MRRVKFEGVLHTCLNLYLIQVLLLACICSLFLLCHEVLEALDNGVGSRFGSTT